MRLSLVHLLMIAALVLLPPTLQAASFHPLGRLHDWGGSSPNDLSPDGSTVVGNGAVGTQESFVWNRSSGMQGLPLKDGMVSSISNGVSSNGTTIVGEMRDFNVGQPFIWDATNGMRELGGPLGGFQQTLATATAVSADGAVVSGVGRNGDGNIEAFIWDAIGGRRGIGDLPGGIFYSSSFAMSADGSVIVGASRSTSGNSEAFIWDATRGMRGLGDLRPEFPESFAFDVSADGSTVVGVGSTQSNRLAFVWDETRGMRSLGDLPGGLVQSRAQGVSADGSVIVGMSYSATGNEAFIWDEAQGMRELDVLLVALGVDLTGWTLVEAMAISDDGLTISGYGTNPAGREEAWIAVIPEPTTVVLLGFGLAYLCGLKRASGPNSREAQS